MLEDKGSVHARNIILTAAAFWVAGALTGNSFQSSTATAQATAPGEHILNQKARIQGNLHGLLGLKFEEHVLKKVNDQIRVTLGNSVKVTPQVIAKTADDAVQRLGTFLDGWRFVTAPSRTWADNNSKATLTSGLGGTNINAIVRPAVILRVKKQLREAITTELNKPINATASIDDALVRRVAEAATGGTSAGFGEWVCIFNPATGQTEWFNEETGEFAGAS